MVKIDLYYINIYFSNKDILLSSKFLHSVNCIKYNILCQICKTLINVQTYDLHKSKCNISSDNTIDLNLLESNIEIKKLNEMVKYSNINNNFNSMSKQSIIKCEYCEKKFYKDKIKIHYSKCSYKTYKCKYCGLTLEKTYVYDHQYLCGSKSENCDRCNKLVVIRDFEAHKLFLCKNIQ